MENPYVVYLLWDPRNGDVRYVGQTKEPEKRFRYHRRGAIRKGHCQIWERSLVKDGLCCETAIVEEGLTEGEVGERERWWIAYARAWGWPLTNHTDGGEGVPGHNHSAESREKMRQSALRRFADPEEHEKLRLAHLGEKHSAEHIERFRRAATGKKRSPEFSERMRQVHTGMKMPREGVEKSRLAHLGLKPSAKTIEAVRRASVGRQKSPEEVEKIRQANLGKNHSAQTKEKLRQANLGHRHSIETKEKMRKSHKALWAQKHQLKEDANDS